MKKAASISHNDAIIRELSDDPKLAAEYLPIDSPCFAILNLHTSQP